MDKAVDKYLDSLFKQEEGEYSQLKIVDKNGLPVLPIIPESLFNEGVSLGIYKEEDRGIKVLIDKCGDGCKIASQLERYEREQPNTPLNMRSRFIKHFGSINGIITKPLEAYLFN